MEPVVTKPFHLLTPAEKTALRIAQNRAIDEKVSVTKIQTPPAKSAAGSAGFTRLTPEDHAKVGSVIRKLKK